MALADPQTITVDSVPKTCNLVIPGENKSVYATTDDEYRLTVSHQETKGDRIRHMARVDVKVIAADPLTSENEYKSLGLYVVIDQPNFGFSDDDIDDVATGFKTWLDSTMVLKILGRQH